MGPNIAWSRKDLQLSLLQCIHQVGAHITKHGQAEEQWKLVNNLFFNAPENAELKEAHYNPDNPRKLKDKWTDMYRNGMLQLKMMGNHDIESSNDEVLKMIKVLHDEKEAAEFSKQRSFRKSSLVAPTIPSLLSSSLTVNPSVSNSKSLPSVLFASGGARDSSSSSPGSEDVQPSKKKRSHASVEISSEENKRAKNSSVVAAISNGTQVPGVISSSIESKTTKNEIPTYERNAREQMIALLAKENKKLKEIIEEMGVKKDKDRVLDTLDEIGLNSVVVLYCSPGEAFSQTYFRDAIERLGVTPLVSLKLYGWLESVRERAAKPSS